MRRSEQHRSKLPLIMLTLAAIMSLLAPAFGAVAVVDAGREADTKCLASAIAYEAGFEPLAGKQAVAEVILNRMRQPGYPKTVCGVVFAGAERRTGCQFTFACDGSLRRHLSAATLASSRAVAEAALAGEAPQRVPQATHYHADYVSPYWAPRLVTVARIGAHIFYRQPAAGERPDAVARPVAPTQSVAAPVAPFAPWGLTIGS